MRIGRWRVGVFLMGLAGATPTSGAIRLEATLQPEALTSSPQGTLPTVRGRLQLQLAADGMVAWELRVADLTGTATETTVRAAAPGTDGPIVETLTNPPTTGTHVGTFGPLDSARQTALFDGLWYVEVRTAANPAGELRGQIRLRVIADQTCGCVAAASPRTFRGCVTGALAGLPKATRLSAAARQLKRAVKHARCGPPPRRIPRATSACCLPQTPIENLVVGRLCAQVRPGACGSLAGRVTTADCWSDGNPCRPPASPSGAFIEAADCPPVPHAGDLFQSSTADGGGALQLSFDFSRQVAATPSFSIGGQTLYSTTDPGLDVICTDEPSAGRWAIDFGTPVSFELVSAAAPVSLKFGSVTLDAAGEQVLLGEMPIGLHVHPEWRLLLPDGVSGEYPVAFRITTSRPAYLPSPIYTLTVTNTTSTSTVDVTTTMVGSTTTAVATTSSTTTTTLAPAACGGFMDLGLAVCRVDLLLADVQALPVNARAQRRLRGTLLRSVTRTARLLQRATAVAERRPHLLAVARRRLVRAGDAIVRARDRGVLRPGEATELMKRCDEARDALSVH